MTQGSYLFYYLFPIFFCLIALKGYRKPKTGLLLVLILLFFSMFRGDHVGNDTLNYMDMGRIQYRGTSIEISFDNFFEKIGNDIEFIDILINRIVYSFSLSPRLIIYVYSLISILFFYKGLKSGKMNPSMGMVCYVLLCAFYFSLTAARQMAAVSVLFYGITFLCQEARKSTIRYIIYNIIAILIHASSIIFLPLLLVKYVHIRNRRLWTYILVLFAFVFVVVSFNVLPRLGNILNMEFFVHTLENYGDGGGRTFFGKMMDLVQYSFMIYVFANRNTVQEYHTKGEGINKSMVQMDSWDYLFIVAFVFSVFCTPLPGMIARVSYFMIVFLCGYIAKFYNLQTSKNRLILIGWIICLCYNAGTFGPSLTSGYYMNFNPF